jgi:hypothetical protein
MPMRMSYYAKFSVKKNVDDQSVDQRVEPDDCNFDDLFILTVYFQCCINCQ